MCLQAAIARSRTLAMPENNVDVLQNIAFNNNLPLGFDSFEALSVSNST